MFDLHVHAAPDIEPRGLDDGATARAFDEAGAQGFVLKAHYDHTTGRAEALRRVHRVDVFGGVALNSHVGGFNPAAVAAALLMGARVVWMPTQDALSHREVGLPCLGHQQPRVACRGYAAPPVDPTQEEPLLAILELVAAADAVLATGHLSTPEAGWVLAAARRAGCRRLLVTHASFTVPGMDPAAAAELAGLGALIEVTGYQLLHQPGMTAARLADLIRTVGPRRVVLSSDAGQTGSPPAPVVLAHLVDALALEGIDRGALEAMAGEIPYGLVAGEGWRPRR